MIPTIGKIATISALLCMLFLVVNPAGAFPAGDRNITCPVAANQGDRMSGLLDLLTEKGYDVSTIQSAIAEGNSSAARDLLQQLKEAANITRPEPPAGKMAFNESRMEGLLDMLGEKGFDVSAVQSAIESGDLDAAHDLLDQVKEAANLTFPGGHHGNGSPACNESAGFPGTGLGRSTVQGSVVTSESQTVSQSQVLQYSDANQAQMPTVPDVGTAGGGRGHRNQFV